jgi:hypothetical protein
MTNKIIEIDLANYRGNSSTTFTGREQGKTVRIKLELEKIDSKSKVKIKIPKGTTSFNPSFFLGLFYESIKKSKTIEVFNTRFNFVFDDDENPEIKEIIKKNIKAALFYAESSLNDQKKGFKL